MKLSNKDVEMRLDEGGGMLEGPNQIKDDIYNNQAGMYETK